jgi:hypothetical protein
MKYLRLPRLKLDPQPPRTRREQPAGQRCQDTPVEKGLKQSRRYQRKEEREKCSYELRFRSLSRPTSNASGSRCHANHFLLLADPRLRSGPSPDMEKRPDRAA